MAVEDQILSRLRRTMQSILRIGDIQIKDNAGAVESRNAGDTAYVDHGLNRVVVHGDNATNAVILDAPAALGASVTFTLMGVDGSSGQFIQTNGAGVLSFADAQSNASLVQIEPFSDADDGTPVTIFTPPANARVLEVNVHLAVAAGGAGASIVVGDNGGTADRYFNATDIDMQFTGTYTVRPLEDNDVGGSPAAIEAAVTDGGQTFSGEVYVEYSTPA
jgi:hypothetical protein